jgi:hypothetical protein
MDVVFRKDAINKGLSRYYTGVKCKHGHDCERYTSGGQCVTCVKISSKKTPEKRAKESKRAKERYHSDPKYRERVSINSKKSFKKHIEERKKYKAEYRKSNMSKIKAQTRKDTLRQKEKYNEDSEYRNKKLEQCKKSYFNNHEKSLKIRDEYRKNNRDELRESSRENTNTLSDRYIRQRLSQRSLLSSKDIPQTLIDAKRAELKLKRKLKNEQTK